MSNPINLEERLGGMARRLERVERVNSLLKVWGSIAIAVLIAAGPFASNVMAKAKPKVVTASQFNLESGGKIVATLGIFSGQPDIVFFDSSGKARVAVGISSTTVGFATYDTSGKLRSSVGGGAADGSLTGTFFYDAAGALRTGVEYDPAAGVTFNGFFSNDGSGNNLSLIGNTLAAVGTLAANDSFMQLSDTSLPRVIEFENSTNEGGVDYDAGDFPTFQSGWGNP